MNRIGIRLTPYGVIGSVPMFDDTQETFVALCKALGDRGIAYFHVMDQTGFFNTLEGQKLTSDAIKELLIKWRSVAPNTAIHPRWRYDKGKGGRTYRQWRH